MTTDNETVGETIAIIVRIGDFKCEQVIPRSTLQQMQSQGFDIGKMVQRDINLLDRMIAAPKQELGLERQTCWKAAAEASKMVAPSNLKQLADSFPELNPSNYGAEDVDKLHNWALEVVQAITTIGQEAESVVLPEPVARRYKDKITGLHHYGGRPTFQEEYQNTEPLYTEHQVRELLDNTKRSTNRDDESVGLREALVRAHYWMDSQAESQSKGGHETFDLMMLRAERNAIKSALDEAPQPQEDALDAERYRFIKRKLSLIGNGDGTCSMQAVNLPARVLGWPDVGDEARLQFLGDAIDAAIAAAKEKAE